MQQNYAARTGSPDNAQARARIRPPYSPNDARAHTFRTDATELRGSFRTNATELRASDDAADDA